MTKQAIPGTFLDPDAMGRLRWRRAVDLEWHGVVLRRYVADVEDGLLSATVGLEPIGTAGRSLWHVSVAHRKMVHGEERFVRYPSWDELKHAKYTLVPADVAMIMVFPRRSVPYVDDHKTALHLWESEDGGIDE